MSIGYKVKHITANKFDFERTYIPPNYVKFILTTYGKIVVGLKMIEVTMPISYTKIDFSDLKFPIINSWQTVGEYTDAELNEIFDVLVSKLPD